MPLGDKDSLRIKDNIKIMIDKGAPDTDIDFYIQDEGFTSNEEFQKFSKQQNIESNDPLNIATERVKKRQEGSTTALDEANAAMAPINTGVPVLDIASKLPVLPGGQSVESIKQKMGLIGAVGKLSETVIAEPALKAQQGKFGEILPSIGTALAVRS